MSRFCTDAWSPTIFCTGLLIVEGSSPSVEISSPLPKTMPWRSSTQAWLTTMSMVRGLRGVGTDVRDRSRLTVAEGDVALLVLELRRQLLGHGELATGDPVPHVLGLRGGLGGEAAVGRTVDRRDGERPVLDR